MVYDSDSIDQIKEQIFHSEDFVVSEVKRIQYLYKLKSEIRYNQSRHEPLRTESVAEHIYGLHIIASYFAPLEHAPGKLDMQKVHEMIDWHDSDEIITGDTISQLKIDRDQPSEMDAARKVVEKIPIHMQQGAIKTMREYYDRKTTEAKFVKALDKAEPIFEMYHDDYKSIFSKNRTTQEHNDKVKFPYMKDHPVITRFCLVMSQRMNEEGFFYKP